VIERESQEQRLRPRRWQERAKDRFTARDVLSEFRHREGVQVAMRERMVAEIVAVLDPASQQAAAVRQRLDPIANHKAGRWYVMTVERLQNRQVRRRKLAGVATIGPGKVIEGHGDRPRVDSGGRGEDQRRQHEYDPRSSHMFKLSQNSTDPFEPVWD
jgi:hypothetical protein